MSDTDITPAIEMLPLHAWHASYGARMVEFAGYHMPIQYDGIIAEHLWTRENAGLFDVSHMGQLQLSGDNVAAALEAIVPSDIARLSRGKMRYSLLLAHDGGILDDLMVTNAGSTLHIVVNGAVKWDDIAYLREHLPDEITLHHDEDSALLALQGPKAAAALQRIGIGAAQSQTITPNDLFFMEAGQFLWNGVSLGISRSGYTGEDGFEISVPVEHVVAFAEALCAQPEVRPVGLGARDSLRLEAGLPLYGHDLSPEIDPVESQLAFAIAKRRREAGDFMGAPRALKNLVDGPPVKRVGFIVGGRQPAREGAEIYAGSVKIGTVTSGGFSPSLQTPIGMGYVDAAHAGAGSTFEIDVRGKRLTATVTPMPFVPHRYHRKGKP